MLDQLRAWLNGTREYNPGVFLYNQLGDNASLKILFQKGRTDYCNKRLQGELLEICISLKSKKNGTQKISNPGLATKPKAIHNSKPVINIGRTGTTKNPASEVHGEGGNATPDQSTKGLSVADQPKRVFTTSVNANAELYSACKNEADKLFKEVMNARAVLFSMVPSELYEDPNRPDLVEARSKLSVFVVTGYNEASRLYDRADYVRINGKLPDDPTPAAENLDELPDHLVKQKLDNLRKNFNKIKNREQTPERVALMQKHSADLIKLEERWLSLHAKK